MRAFSLLVAAILLFSCAKKTERLGYSESRDETDYYNEFMFRFNQDEDPDVLQSGDINTELLYITDKNFYKSKDDQVARDRFTKAVNFYNQKNYEKALEHYISAIKWHSFGLFYYDLGNCLFDMHDYEQAKASFKKAIMVFEGSGWDSPVDYLYSHDDNGMKREKYFAYYNIACIESLENNIDLAYQYLCEAIIHGYPYIDHLKNDKDLSNLFAETSRLESVVALYENGFNNTVVGNIYELRMGGPNIYIHFEDEKTFTERVYYENVNKYELWDYEVKNYQVFSDAYAFTALHLGNEGFINIKKFEEADQHGEYFRKITYEDMYKYYEYDF